jgi:hypothetical protein
MANQNGKSCDICGVHGETRMCGYCGRTEYVIDCGHHAQPAPIAYGDGVDVSTDELICEACLDRLG